MYNIFDDIINNLLTYGIKSIVKLYKFTLSLDIVKNISIGIFRFYELTKYIKIEDAAGRSDPEECSVNFLREECDKYPEKLPVVSYNGVEFKCSRLGKNAEYIKQYFVFCMSTKKDVNAIDDSSYLVELQKDIFDTIMYFINEPYEEFTELDGQKLFSHSEVEYYDIDNHPKPIIRERWREVYIKHAKFEYQSEYRASFFASDELFNRISIKPMVIKRYIYSQDKKPMGFNLEFYINAGVDDKGSRFIEIDISTFAKNIYAESSNIIKITLH